MLFILECLKKGWKEDRIRWKSQSLCAPYQHEVRSMQQYFAAISNQPATSLLLLLLIVQIYDKLALWKSKYISAVNTCPTCWRHEETSIWWPGAVLLAAPWAAVEAFPQLLEMSKMWCLGPEAARKVPSLSPSIWCSQQAFGSKVVALNWTQTVSGASIGPTSGHTWMYYHG